MTVRIVPIEHKYKRPWQRVVNRFWRKFPHRDMPEVLSVDVVDESVDEDTGVVRRTRRMRITNTLPWVVRKIISGDHIEFEEKSVYDERRQMLRLRSRNITASSIVECDEESTFYPDPSNPSRNTVFFQTGGITAHMGPLSRLIEKFVAPRFRVAGHEAALMLDSMMDEDDEEQRKKEAGEKEAGGK